MTGTLGEKLGVIRGASEDQAVADTRSPSGRKWPELRSIAYQGLAGEIVTEVTPYTEADPAAMLATLLAGSGSLAGRKAHVFAGDTEHPARLWPLIIGKTAGGMKGTSWAAILRVLLAADPLMGPRIAKGLSTGEGLIEAVRDPVGEPDDKYFDEGVLDKRLLLVEPEFASVLSRGSRDGNTLMTTLREAWDGGTLRTMSRKSSQLKATDPHIVLIGHITPRELKIKLTEDQLVGGTMNRLLPVLSKRSKKLPDGGGTPEETVRKLGARLRDALDATVTVGRMERTQAAATYWRAEAYDRLTSDHFPDGPVAQILARAVPQVLRLSVAYALLDGSREIGIEHLQAAEALWSFVEDSVWYVFGGGTGNPDLDRLKTFVEAAGSDGADRTSINNECFSKHRTKAEIDSLIADLLALGGYEEWQQPTGGRPRVLYRRKKGI